MESILKVIEYLLESFKGSPATLVLLLIVLIQHRTQERLMDGAIEDAERQSKMITLLEILVGRSR
jgi:hypothetical protein